MDSALGDRGDGAPGTARSGDPGHRPAEIIALLGRGTHFEGKLFFEGRVRIDGSFKGEIRGEDVLVIGEGAKVVGEVQVSTCIVTGGEVEANVRARDAIELYAPSRVVGALHAPAIFIDRGVKFEGSCKMAPLDDEPAPVAERAPHVEEPAPVTPRAGTIPGEGR
jgi:cytoskeletal protein CcmA (bactofilin family)